MVVKVENCGCGQGELVADGIEEQEVIECGAARVGGAMVRGLRVGNENELAGLNCCAERKVGGYVALGRVPVALDR